jgi:hypothetical protein
MGTGSRLATGVSVPVRPTWLNIENTRRRLPRLELKAIAQRGERAISPKRLCNSVLLT